MDLKEELFDRFGKFALLSLDKRSALENLFSLIGLKLTASAGNIRSIIQKNNLVTIDISGTKHRIDVTGLSAEEIIKKTEDAARALIKA